jgi:hypothetical protein
MSGFSKSKKGSEEAKAGGNLILRPGNVMHFFREMRETILSELGEECAHMLNTETLGEKFEYAPIQEADWMPPVAEGEQPPPAAIL